jgi:IS30 family transposase
MRIGAGVRAFSAQVREPFWAARAEGAVIKVAAERAGVSHGAASEWVRAAGGVRPRRPVPASGRFLSQDEREEIALGLACKLSRAEIGRRIGRDRATVGREIARNIGSNGQYRALRADRLAELRRRRPKPAKLVVHAELRARVQQDLLAKWSPEQIALRLRREFPDRPEMWVSHETIYQSLYVQSRGALRRELTSCLRTGRAIRRPKQRAAERRGHIPNMIMISERPAEAADRAVPGHWEGDLIIGKDNKTAIGTLVERSTRYCLLLHLPIDHRAETVRDAMLGTIATLPTHLIRSLTWDQGVEMNDHAAITIATGLPIYFCDPHSPWQRGSNENTNGLLRQYFPKSTNLAQHSRQHLDHVAAELNGRPRKTLAWKTPAEALNELLLQ